LGCRHYSLFDFRIDPDGQPWFLEAGLFCSFAEISVLSAMAKASGISLDTFFESMLQNALPGRSESPLALVASDGKRIAR
jgi:D-alanine-D-alanine ligase